MACKCCKVIIPLHVKIYNIHTYVYNLNRFQICIKTFATSAIAAAILVPKSADFIWYIL